MVSQLVRTAHLDLRPTDPADAVDLFPIFSDPGGWWYDPDGRHLDLARTEAWLTRSAGRWPGDGLSYWTVRRADSGEVVGVGGAQRHRSGSWNINYRVGAHHQGRGFGVEIARAGVAAAHEVDDAVPVIAWVVEHNVPSRRVAERAGLVDRGEFIDASDGAVRHAYADRDLTDFVEHLSPGR